MIPFRIGDVVKTENCDRAIVCETSMCQGDFSYGLCYEYGGASWWFDHDDLTLVADATEETVEIAIHCLDEEEDDDDD